MPDIKNILVVRTDRIGDVVLTTPAIHALRKKFPQANITVLLQPLTVPLLENDPHISHILVDDRKGTYKGVLGFWKLVREIRNHQFDLAVIYHTKRRTNALCFAAGIPTRLGYKNNKLGFLLNRPVEDVRHLGLKHEAEYCLDLLQFLDIQSQSVELLLYSKDREMSLDSLFVKNPNQRLVAFHPGASDPSKCWTDNGFIEIGKRLMDKGDCQIVIVGAGNILDVAQYISEGIGAKDNRVCNLVSKTTITQMMEVLKSCDLLLSNDSGPVHIAAALGTPVVSIFTRNQPGINPERWRPLGKMSSYVTVPAESPQDFSIAKAQEESFRSRISVDEVWRHVRVGVGLSL